MPNTKEVESSGSKALSQYLRTHLDLPDEALRETMNKGRAQARLGCDFELDYRGRTYYLELKAFSSPKVPTNIRFTHQTIASLYEVGLLGQLIVAIVYNLKDGPDAACFRFFRLGAVPVTSIYVEPHFLIQPRAIQSLLQEHVDLALESESPSMDLESIFDSTVRNHMRWSKGPAEQIGPGRG